MRGLQTVARGVNPGVACTPSPKMGLTPPAPHFRGYGGFVPYWVNTAGVRGFTPPGVIWFHV